MKVSDMLLEGRENAVTGGRLVDALALKDLRELTQLVEGERRAGAPICASTGSDSHGYYLAKDSAELEDYMGSLDRRIRNVSRTRQHLETTLLRMTGQEKMGGC